MEIKDNILIDVDELDIIEGTLIVPSDIIEIADSAFKDDQIIKVELPSSIKKIGVKAFSRLKKIKEIIESAKDGVSAAIDTVVMFCQRMAEFAKKALETIGTGVVIAFSLPFLFAFAVYKGALKICTALVEKVKDGAKVRASIVSNQTEESK